MSDYIEPSKEAFESAEQVATDVLEQASPSILVKTGSVVHELIVRPIAYLIAWATENLSEARRKSSIAYLKTSQETENEVADLVASNYFVERRQGTQAKGIVTLTIQSPTVRLASGAGFTVGGTPVHTPTQYLITPTPPANPDPQSGVTYLKAYANGDGTYDANVPVVTDEIGNFEIPLGVGVTIEFASVDVVSAELTSPITGGSSTETDAQLMQRAAYNTAESGIGTYYGLLKKFNHAPVTVMSLYTVSGEEEALYRARYNNVNINPGGIVDCYIKTSNQPQIGHLELTVTGGTINSISQTTTVDVQTSDTDEESSETNEAEVVPQITGEDTAVQLFTGTVTIADPQYAGLYSVPALQIAGGTIYNIQTTFSAPAGQSGIGARLSADQLTTVVFQVDLQGGTVDTVTAGVVYMPNISDLQTFIDGDAESFLGLDIRCKAAVPVEVHISCDIVTELDLTNEDIDSLKQAIASTVNALPVGTKAVNFSDLRNACATVRPGVDLRLPCVMTGFRYTKNGGTESLYSNSGILDLTTPVRSDVFDYQMCYFYTTKDFIKLGIL